MYLFFINLTIEERAIWCFAKERHAIDYLDIVFANNPLCSPELRRFTDPTNLGAFFYTLRIMFTFSNLVS